jgi:hypothetical protein
MISGKFHLMRQSVSSKGKEERMGGCREGVRRGRSYPSQHQRTINVRMEDYDLIEKESQILGLSKRAIIHAMVEKWVDRDRDRRKGGKDEVS